MKLSKRWVAGAALATLIATLTPGSATGAVSTTPSWEPDANSGSFGTLSFYNAAGAKVTSGTDLSHLFDFAVASSAEDPNQFHKANIVFAFPNHSQPTSGWFVANGSTATTYPVTSGPASITGLPSDTPVAKIAINEANLTATLGAGTLDTTAGYANIMQIRLLQSGNDAGYWTGDVQYDTAAGTWTQVYPTVVAGPSATTTTVTPSPASPQVSGTNVTFTAAVSPAAAGTVQFKDGANDLGTPVTVASGSASFPTTSLSVGSHSITGVFTPSDTAAFSGSTSAAVPYTITPAPTQTSTALDISPTSPITVGTVSTLTATVTPAGAVGSVQFKDGATNIGSPVAVSGGTAITTNTFAVNTHSVTAVFTPTDSNAFSTSTSGAVSYVVNAQPATPTATTLDVSPSSPQTYGTTVTLTGHVDHTQATGSIQFFDAGTQIGSDATVSNGTASITTSALAAGDHTLTAKFVPAVPADFGTSTSIGVSYLINKAPTTTTFVATPASPVTQGTSVKLEATVTGGVVGTVQFFDGPNTVGSPVPVTNAKASTNVSNLSVGTHSLTATFTPDTNHSQSTSTATSFVVNPPPPGDTTTALSVSPTGPVGPNTVETLKATISPSGAGGSVQFMDGATAVGSPATVTNGVAQTTTTLAVGSHSLTAAFTSGNPTSFKDSQTTAPATFVVKPAAAVTTTTLDVTPTGPVTFGTAVSLHSTVSAGTGTVAFTDGPTTLGNVAVANGSATLTTIALTGGSHSLKASFVPSAPLDFAPSASNVVNFTVNAVTTTTSLAVTAGPVTVGAEVTMTATVTPAVAGTVAFKNGSTVLGSAPVASGNAVFKTKALPIGTASLTASFTASAPANYSGSQSAPLTLAVEAAPVISSATSGGKTIKDGATLKPGQTVTVQASGFQSEESVDVTVRSTPVKLATVTASGQGTVTATVTLPKTLTAGAHTLTFSGRVGSAVFHFSIAGAVAPSTPTTPGSTLSGAGGTSSGPLALTGSNIMIMTLLGLVLAVSGAIVMKLGVRRHRGLHRVG
ncbi:MAG: hypothetical protein QOE97_2970 [Pseudonocardiales bacterium]|nr:hypothetical protein [Pseudonocardiales bacterium]